MPVFSLWVIFLFLSLPCYSLSPAYSQTLNPPIVISSTYNPVGSGARALGYGGAFIAIADDATAASWNPAGLVQLKTPELSGVGSLFLRMEGFDSTRKLSFGGLDHADAIDLNYLSAAYPFHLFDRNMVVSINYFQQFEFERRLKFSHISRKTLFPAIPFEVVRNFDFKQKGELNTLSPAYAIQITPGLSFGIAWNLWGHIFERSGWEGNLIGAGIGRMGDETFTTSLIQQDRFKNFRGNNFNLGLRWRMTPKLTLGAVLETPFEAKVHRRMVITTSDTLFQPTPLTQVLTDEGQKIRFPLSFGIGLSYRFSDNFSLALDLFRTEWDDFVLKDRRGNRESPIGSIPKSRSDVKETHQFRMGGEYLFILEKTVIPVRFGFFTDPVPSQKNPETFVGFALGSGISLGPLILDFAYQFRTRGEVGGDSLGMPGSSAGISQHNFLVSAIFHF